MKDQKKSWGELKKLYIDSVNTLERFLSEVPLEAFTYRPPREGAWTISEHVRHLADNEMNFALRAKMAVAQPGTTVMLLDQEAWVQSVYKAHESWEDYLALFKHLRGILLGFLDTLSEDEAQRAWIQHPERGRMSLVDLLELYAGHVDFHLVYMRENVEQFRRAGLG